MSDRTGGSGRVGVFLGGAALLSLTMLLVSAANYVLNFALARMLPPAQFGDATLAITLVLTAAVVAATLQLVASRTAAANPASLDAIRRLLLRTAAIIGLSAALVLGTGAWILADLLRTSTPWIFVLIGAGLPVYFVQAVHRGLLQGDLRFRRLALSYAAEAFVRVAVVLGLVAAGLGVLGASVGILLSFLASAAVARTRPARGAPGPALRRGALRVGVTAALTMMLAQTLLNNADLIIAKSTFDPETAGVYAAAAVLCRSLYFVSWSIVQVVVPVLASVSSTVAERRRSLTLAIALIGGLGAIGTVVVALGGGMLVSLLFGPDYIAAASLLLPYTLATSLLSLAALLAAVDIARGRTTGPVVLLAGAALQVAVLAIAAQTPAEMVWLQVATSAATLCALVVAALVRRHRRAPRPPHTPPEPHAIAGHVAVHTAEGPAVAEQRSS